MSSQPFRFGDIFQASYLFDVHLREDAQRWRQGVFPKNVGIDEPFYTTADDKRLKIGDKRVVAHAEEPPEPEGWGLLLSEDCHIQTVLGNREDRDEVRGRLWFCIIEPAGFEQVEGVRAGRNYGRHGLLEDGAAGFPGGIAHLKNLFSGDARCISETDRKLVLSDPERDLLARRWFALCGRRGPFAGEDRAGKVAALAAGGKGKPGTDEQDAATAVWRVLDATWGIDGDQLEAVGGALEAGAFEGSELGDLATSLDGLSALAKEAADRIRSVS